MLLKLYLIINKVIRMILTVDLEFKKIEVNLKI